MEIKRVGENKIRCALTEDEIREMGFDIDEIIGNGEATQKFMRVVLKIVEEKQSCFPITAWQSHLAEIPI